MSKVPDEDEADKMDQTLLGRNVFCNNNIIYKITGMSETIDYHVGHGAMNLDHIF